MGNTDIMKDGISLAIQWLGLYTSNVEGKGSIPGWGTKIPRGTCHGQKFFFNFFNYERCCCGVGNQGKVGFAWRNQRKLQKGYEDSVGAGSQENKEGKPGSTFIPSEQRIQV